MQGVLFPPVSNWKPPSMSDLPRWGAAECIGYDVETKDPRLKEKPSVGPGVYRKDGHVVGYGIAIENGPSLYLPIRHEGGDNLPEAGVLRYMRDNSKVFKGQAILANGQYDVDWSQNDDIVFHDAAVLRDIQIIEPLIYELHPSMSLDSILERRGFPLKNEELLKEAMITYGLAGKKRNDFKSKLYKCPARYVGGYCEYDAASPIPVFRQMEKQITDLGLWDIVNLETKVMRVLLKMRRRGVLIDLDRLQRIEDWALHQEQEALRKIKHLTGVNLAVGQVWAKDPLVPIFHSLGIHLKKMKPKKNGKPEFQIDAALFSEHLKDKPAIQALAWARKVNKVRTTFANSVRRSLCPDGRIHCSFKQIAMEGEDGEEKGARFGRMSCVAPNLQQQPSRDPEWAEEEYTKEWRAIYIPEHGTEWGCLDFSQQEPRWTTHFAASVNVGAGTPLAKKLRWYGKLQGAEEACQAYWDDPMLDNHDFMAKLTGLKRKFAKNIYLGLCYGEGGAKLCTDLGLPTAWCVLFTETREKKLFNNLEDAMEAVDQYEGTARYWETAGPEGQKIIDTFDQRAPFIRKLADVCKARVEMNGWIRTGGGRILHFPRKKDGTYDWTHKALNRLIQGTSADQMKAGMVAIDREMPDFFLQLQVHDELDASGTRAQFLQAAAIMRECMGKTKVPFRVDVEAGPNWGHIEKVAA
jgi:DNA polymerase I-like protein with 3'-5' exonuclease and polymerase domains